MAQNGFHIDLDLCYNCKQCEIACADWNNVEVGEYDLPTQGANPDRESPDPINAQWMGFYEEEKGQFPDTEVTTSPLPCFQCENPVCAEAAPENALYKREEDGTVFVDQSKLDEEQSEAVEEACPFGRIQIPDRDMPASDNYPDGKPAGIATKCNACFARDEQPACVDVCQTQALDYGPMEELRSEYSDADQEPLKEMFGADAVEETMPAVIFSQ